MLLDDIEEGDEATAPVQPPVAVAATSRRRLTDNAVPQAPPARRLLGKRSTLLDASAAALRRRAARGSTLSAAALPSSKGRPGNESEDGDDEVEDAEDCEEADGGAEADSATLREYAVRVDQLEAQLAAAAEAASAAPSVALGAAEARIATLQEEQLAAAAPPRCDFGHEASLRALASEIEALQQSSTRDAASIAALTARVAELQGGAPGEEREPAPGISAVGVRGAAVVVEAEPTADVPSAAAPPPMQGVRPLVKRGLAGRKRSHSVAAAASAPLQPVQAATRRGRAPAAPATAEPAAGSVVARQWWEPQHSAAVGASGPSALPVAPRSAALLGLSAASNAASAAQPHAKPSHRELGASTVPAGGTGALSSRTPMVQRLRSRPGGGH